MGVGQSCSIASFIDLPSVRNTGAIENTKPNPIQSVFKKPEKRPANKPITVQEEVRTRAVVDVGREERVRRTGEG